MAGANDESRSKMLEEFEKKVNYDNPDQMRLLEVMRKETNRINQLWGVWNKSSTHRDWNDVKAVGKEQTPLAIEAYREYKQHLQGRAAKKFLPAPLPNDKKIAR